jgi:hypothetical protein
MAKDDLSPVDLITLCLKSIGDVHSGHGTEQRSMFSRLPLETKFDNTHLVFLAFCRRLFDCRFLKKSRPFLFDLLYVALGRERREPLRKQIISGITRFHFDDLAAAAELIDIFA